MEEQNKKVKQYDVMKNQWMSFLPEQETNFRRWRELKNLVGKLLKWEELKVIECLFN